MNNSVVISRYELDQLQKQAEVLAVLKQEGITVEDLSDFLLLVKTRGEQGISLSEFAKLCK